MNIKNIVGKWCVIILSSLVVVILWQNFSEFLPKSEVMAYEAECDSLACAIEDRAQVIYNEREPINREHARIEAIAEYNIELQDILQVSPYVDYPQLWLQYGS